MAAAIAQAQEMGKAARIKAFDIAAPANFQGRHFRVTRVKRLGKPSPIPHILLRPTSLSSRLTTLLPSLLPHPPNRSVPRGNFRPIFLYPHPLFSYTQIRLLKLPIPPQFRCRAF